MNRRSSLGSCILNNIVGDDGALPLQKGGKYRNCCAVLEFAERECVLQMGINSGGTAENIPSSLYRGTEVFLYLFVKIQNEI